MSDGLHWRKSTFSDQIQGEGNCVEVARSGDWMLMRDSKDPNGPVHAYNRQEWAAFLAGVKAGEFDPPDRT